MKKISGTKLRNSNFEILRIISIILIVAFHSFIYTDNDLTKSIFGLNFVLGSCMGIWGILGVDAFILVSSYFLIDSEKIKFEKILKIIIQTIFYNMLLLFIFYRMGLCDFNFKQLAKSICSPFSGEYWFITAYIMLYLLHPFINNMLKKMDDKYLVKFLIVYIILFYALRMIITGADVSGFDLLIYIYILMYYLKKNTENWFEKNCKRGFVILTLCIYICTIAINFVGTRLQVDILREHTKFLVTRSSILILVDAVFLFYIFKNIDVKASKIINSIASSTLGVYILHENRFTKSILWNDILRLDKYYYNKYFIFMMMVYVFLIFIIGTVVDLFRKNILERIVFNKRNKLLMKFNKKIDSFYNN